MGMSESDFHEAADAWLDQLFELLESEDMEGTLDLDYDEGRITIIADEDHVFKLRKRSSTQQMVLSSPISGVLEFDAVDDGSDWALEDGRRLSVVLAEELQHVTGEEFTPNVL